MKTNKIKEFFKRLWKWLNQPVPKDFQRVCPACGRINCHYDCLWI